MGLIFNLCSPGNGYLCRLHRLIGGDSGFCVDAIALEIYPSALYLLGEYLSLAYPFKQLALTSGWTFSCSV